MSGGTVHERLTEYKVVCAHVTDRLLFKIHLKVVRQMISASPYQGDP